MAQNSLTETTCCHNKWLVGFINTKFATAVNIIIVVQPFHFAAIFVIVVNIYIVIYIKLMFFIYTNILTAVVNI